MDANIFNAALEMTLEWGENFHKPIQERIRRAYPALTEAEADTLDSLCREIMYYAFEQIEHSYTEKNSGQQETAAIKAKYPLINEQNMASMWSQGQYYAWHDNG